MPVMEGDRAYNIGGSGSLSSREQFYATQNSEKRPNIIIWCSGFKNNCVTLIGPNCEKSVVLLPEMIDL